MIGMVDQVDEEREERNRIIVIHEKKNRKAVKSSAKLPKLPLSIRS